MPKVGLGMTVILFCFYAAFILTGAFNPAMLARPVAEGGLTTYAFIFGLAVIFSTILLAALYVMIANIAAARD